MKYYILLILSIYFISCKNTETIKKVENNNIALSYGWISEDKYITSAIGYPSSNIENTNQKESAYNAAIALLKIKIETALLKEVNNIDDQKIENIKEFISSNLKILEENYIDNRYYKIIASIEQENLLFNLRNNNL